VARGAQGNHRCSVPPCTQASRDLGWHHLHLRAPLGHQLPCLKGSTGEPDLLCIHLPLCGEWERGWGGVNRGRQRGGQRAPGWKGVEGVGKGSHTLCIVTASVGSVASWAQPRHSASGL